MKSTKTRLSSHLGIEIGTFDEIRIDEHSLTNVEFEESSAHLMRKRDAVHINLVNFVVAMYYCCLSF